MRAFAKGLLGLGLVAAGVGGWYAASRAYRAAAIYAAYGAKTLCSGVFVSKRDERLVLSDDDMAALNWVSLSIDYGDRAAVGSIFGLFQRRAFFRDGLGCTLELGLSEREIRTRDGDGLPQLHGPSGEPWATGDLLVESDSAGVDRFSLSDVLQEAFARPGATHGPGTRAVLVVYDGHIVAERYAAGFSGDTRFPGFGMSAFVVNALVGIVAGQRALSVGAPLLVPEWQRDDDPRRTITLEQLLHMSSGLAFTEDARDPFSDEMTMLYGEPDAAAFAAAKPLIANPGTRWSYASGTTNIITRFLRAVLGGSPADYLSFPRRALFDPIGMRSAVIEADASGTLIGSTFMYASARDWARLGLLYLRDGVWEGSEILPPGWIEYSLTPARAAPEAGYGAHIWLNVGRAESATDRPYPHIPPDAFFALGRYGQALVAIPSRRTVIVHLGLTRDERDWDLDRFVRAVLDALPAH